MPKVTYNNKNFEKPKQIKELTCSGCSELKRNSEFYVSYNPLHATKRLPYCKKCIHKMSTNKDGSIMVDKLQDTLKLINRPFICELWELSIEENSSTPIGTYFKNLGLKQNRQLTWKDSEFEGEIKSKKNNDGVNIIKSTNNTKLEDFALTDEIIDKWGFGYSKEEYYYFEKKWLKLIDNYGEKTSFHVEGLITYIRFRVKEELATARGDIKEAKDWGTMAKDAASAAKINVSQLSKADLSGGVDLLPQLFEAVETEAGIIPILPRLKEQPYDDVDMIIWANINYQRRLEGKPRIEYKDIWKFYDEMLGEHYKTKGLTKKQIELEKQKRNNIFKDLGKVYKEPVYEDGEE